MKQNPPGGSKNEFSRKNSTCSVTFSVFLCPHQPEVLCHYAFFLLCARGTPNRTDSKKNLQGSSSTTTQRRAWTEGCMILRPQTMSAFICIWACFLLRISVSGAAAAAAAQEKTPGEKQTRLCLRDEPAKTPGRVRFERRIGSRIWLEQIGPD